MNRQYGIGLAFLAFGALALLNNMGIVSIGLGNLWPLIVLGIGVYNFVRDPFGTGPMVTIAVGASFTLAHTTPLGISSGITLVPFILVAIGTSFLVHRNRGPRVHIDMDRDDDRYDDDEDWS